MTSILILLGFTLLVTIITLVKMSVEKHIDEIKLQKGLKIARKYEAIYQKGLLKSYYLQLKETIYINELLDEAHLSRKAFFIMSSILIRVFIVTAIYVLFARNVFVLMAIPVAVVLFESSLVKYLRSHDLQMHLRSGIELFKNRYIECENCKMALEETIKEREGTVRRHLELLLSLIDAPSAEAKKRLNDYFITMPNDHLKLIAMNNHIAYFEGDRKEDGESILIKNTQSVINQMRKGNTQREKFFREIKTDKWVMLSPIILLPLIRMFMMYFSSNMPETDMFLTVFYNGIYGQIIVAFVLITMLFAYKVYSKFVGDKYLVTTKEVKLYRWLMPLTNRVVPKDGSTKRERLKETFMLSGKVMTVESFYQSRLLTSLLLVVFSVTFLQVNHFIEENKIVNNLLYTQQNKAYYQNLEILISNKSDDEKKKEISDEKIIINKFLHEDVKGEELRAALKDIGLSSTQIERIATKIEVLRGISPESYKLVLLFLSIGVIGYYYPLFSLQMDQYINSKAYVADDITRLYNVAMVLSRNKNMTVKEMLKWLENFSVAFKPVFNEINEKYHTEGIAVLQKMYRDMPYEEMKLLLDNLSSGESVPLSKALRGIEHTLKNKLEDRDEEIEYGINFQITLSEEMARIVQLITTALYGAVPLFISIYLMISQMNDSIKEF